MAERSCAVCSVALHERRQRNYCGAECRRKAKLARTKRWFEANPDYLEPTITVACVVCGTRFEKARREVERWPTHCCSNECKAWTKRTVFSCDLAWASCLRCRKVWLVRHGRSRCECHADSTRLGPVCRLPSLRYGDERTPKKWRPTQFIGGQCARCGASYIGRRFKGANGYCSRSCKRAAAKEREEILKRGAFVANVNRKEIYERDGWRCKLCGKRVKQTAQVPDPKAPTLDHIIPLSLGGTHEPANVQLAHFGCNTRKNNRLDGDQLLLVG